MQTAPIEVTRDFNAHPTVLAHRSAAFEPARPTVLDADWLRERCLAAGAADAGFFDLADPALDDQRDIIRAAFPRTRALLSLVVRMNREDIRILMFPSA